LSQQDAVNANDRTIKALLLRKAGLPYPEIANELGFNSPQAAFGAVKRALKKTLQEPSEELRKLELERLDAIFNPQYEQAKGGDSRAAEVALKVLDQRAKMLGLYPPVKIAPTNPDGTQEYGATDRQLLSKLLSDATDGDPASTVSQVDAQTAP
jgi:hypothetical protein